MTSFITAIFLLWLRWPAFAQGTADGLLACLGFQANQSSFLTAASDGWAAAIAPFNLRIAPQPLAVYSPSTKSGIAKALSCAQQAGVKVSPLCGGHSFVSYGLGGNDGAFVLNMEHFKDISLSKDGQTAKIAGGARIGDVINYLYDHGEYMFPHARGSNVGLAGSAIGGGFGTISRMAGTTLDNIVGVDMILPNGTEVHSSATKNPDILFASLGAASSFGVLTNLYMKTWPAPTWDVTSYSYVLQPINASQAARVFSSLQAFVRTQAPQELAIRFHPRFATRSEISGWYYGEPNGFESAIQPLLSTLPPVNESTIRTCSFIESEASIVGTLNMSQPYTSQRTFYTQSIIVDQPFSDATLLEYMRFHEADADGHSGIDVNSYADFWGSPEGSTTPTTQLSSFPHNNTLLLWRVDGTTTNTSMPWPVDGVEFMQKFTRPLFDSQNAPRSYVNYRDSAYTEEEWESRYYSAAINKLKVIKAEIDPAQVMSPNPQSIPLP